MKKCVFIFVFAVAVLASCADEPHGNFNRTAFNRERQLWLKQGIQNYSFRLYDGSMSGPRRAIMYIKDGVLAYIQVEGTDKAPVPVEKKYYIPNFLGKTISDIYAEIEKMAGDAGRRDTVEIKYDSEWHYPEYFSCDWAAGNFREVNINKFIIDPD